MDTPEKIALFKERFVHRDDVYAYQWFDKEKGQTYIVARTGTCNHKPPCQRGRCKNIHDTPLDDEAILKHLQGKQTIATYQLREDNTVKWLCLDVDLLKGQEDNEDMREKVRQHTVALAKRLNKIFGPNSFLVERSGSKGYHLWVFFSEPVMAFQLFSLGRWIEESTPAPDGIGVEVYPKQTKATSYGSMVKLPLGVHQKTGVRCFFVNNKFEDAEQWDKLANVQTFTANDVKKALGDYRVPIVPTIRTDAGSTVHGALPCISNMMAEGLTEGQRDEGFLILASWAKRRGIPEYAAAAMLHAVNGQSNPPLEEQQVDTKITSAYNADYSEFPCAKKLLDGYCSSKCRFFPEKSRTRWQRYGKEGDGRGVISRD